MPGPISAPRRQPRQRLASINNPSTMSALQSRPSPSPAPPAQPVKRPQKRCCGSPDIGEEDGKIVCFNCAEVHEQSAVVSEVTFSEQANGGVTVQGGTIGDNQRFAASMGGVVSGVNVNSVDSRQTAFNRGKNMIAGLVSKLGIRDNVRINAEKLYTLALNHSLVQGRGIVKIAAASLYLAARRVPGNTLLLMDLAEALSLSIWELGAVYRKFLDTLMLKEPDNVHASNTVLHIEPLMLKFCERLEFDQDAHKVAQDACLILKRMSRDWMVEGRNPAGLCGACIILAARMNNFRRTVREVVYVVKVADTTINQRLYEFRRTRSSKLPVAEFRKVAARLKGEAEPPAIYKRREREARAAERKRKASALENGEADISSDGDDGTGYGADDGEGSSQPGPSKQTKRQERMRKKQKVNSGEAGAAPSEAETPSQTHGEDAEALVVDVDALAGDEAGLDAIADANDDVEKMAMPKKRGRPPNKREPIHIPKEDLAIEAAIEYEMIETMGTWKTMVDAWKGQKDHEKFIEALEKARALVQLHQPESNANGEEEIREDEFEDDPDVANVKLSEEEMRIKERIWILENEDWLRQQQQKILAKALEEASGKPKKPKQKRRHRVMGDGSVLEGQPAGSAAAATKKMMEKRAKHFSSHINYEILKQIMPGDRSASSGGTTPAEQPASPAPEQPASMYQTVPVGEDDEEQEEEEYEEEQQYAEEEEEDLEHRYLSDEDEGFDENENYDY